MSKIIRNFFASAAIGFMIPTLAFATIEEPASMANPKYLFQLSYDDAEGAIGFALADKGAGNKVAATINGHKTDALFSYNKPISVEIRGLQFDKGNGRWNASLLFVHDGDTVSAMPVSGRFEELTEIPMLKRQIRAGDVIKESDVEIRDYAVSRTRSDTITDIASLVGKSPSRAVSPNRPIREQEIAQPVLIKKNGIVQMRYTSPGVEITASGQATEDGSRGSVISVKNLNSKKLVRAVVEDENTVAIISARIQTSAITKGSHYAAD